MKKDIVAEEIAIIDSLLARVRLDKLEYSEGDIAFVIVVEPDANTDSRKIETIEVKVSSTSDPIGLQVMCLETGPNTATFVGRISLTNKPTEGTNLQVRKGDLVTISYIDTTLPHKLSEELHLEEKKISFSARVL